MATIGLPGFHQLCLAPLPHTRRSCSRNQTIVSTPAMNPNSYSSGARSGGRQTTCASAQRSGQSMHTATVLPTAGRRPAFRLSRTSRPYAGRRSYLAGFMADAPTRARSNVALSLAAAEKGITTARAVLGREAMSAWRTVGRSLRHLPARVLDALTDPTLQFVLRPRDCTCA